MSKLSENDVEEFLKTLPTWGRDGDFLVREHISESAEAAIARFNAIAERAEAAHHHPNLTWVYNRLSIRLQTHDAGGITAQDTDLARQIEEVLL
ncbi:MAG: 4a-hydroxytetrahydrobiopterin dehydratase [Polyangiales bacterium]|jgi:4a-hydroxytetrahydrobiopterin dehydratase